MSDDFDPREALAVAQATRARMAGRADTTPGWYGIAYGLMCGLIVASAGIPAPWGLLLLGFSLCALAFLYRYWTQLTGLSVNGYRKGRTRTIAVTLAIVLVGLSLLGLYLRRTLGLDWAPFATGGAAVPIAILASWAWDRAWRREILAEVAA
ncbi:MAG TPA: hypothetical protein VMG08_13265 [Allosphingosinicella sp.]|nr:hypothetical protein [Allosphingosinicella sp.]